MKQKIFFFISLAVFLVILVVFGFNNSKSRETPTNVPVLTPIDIPSITPTTEPSPTPTMSPTIEIWNDPRNPEDWKTWSIEPTVYTPMKDLYKLGLDEGHNPHVFSKFGDCQNVTNFFLAGLDSEWGQSKMGSYQYLLDTVQWYRGSFQRDSIAVMGGMNIAGVQNLYPWQGTPPECTYGESRAACEIRVNNPSVALISYEELWDGDTGKYADYLDRLIVMMMDNKVVPILATTSTNEHANLIIAKEAVKYSLPVWNFWASLQGIPNNGIGEDGFHLTIGEFYNFEDSNNMQKGWPNRNLTALMALHSVRIQLNENK